MKKTFKFFRALFIICLWTVLFLIGSSIWMKHHWNFNLLSADDWEKISYFWNHGGVIKQQKDVLFSLNIIILPFVWFFIGRILIKINYLKMLLSPINAYSSWKINQIRPGKRIVLKNMQSSAKDAEELKAKLDAIKPKGAKEKENIRRNLSAHLLGSKTEDEK